MICPLSVIGKQNSMECEEMNCAIWSRMDQCCFIRALILSINTYIGSRRLG